MDERSSFAFFAAQKFFRLTIEEFTEKDTKSAFGTASCFFVIFESVEVQLFPR